MHVHEISSTGMVFPFFALRTATSPFARSYQSNLLWAWGLRIRFKTDKRQLDRHVSTGVHDLRFPCVPALGPSAPSVYKFSRAPAGKQTEVPHSVDLGFSGPYIFLLARAVLPCSDRHAAPRLHLLHQVHGFATALACAACASTSRC